MATNSDLKSVFKKLPLQTVCDLEDLEICFEPNNINSSTNKIDFEAILFKDFNTTNLHDREVVALLNSKFSMVFSDQLRGSMVLKEVTVKRPIIIGYSLVYYLIKEAIVNKSRNDLRLDADDVKEHFSKWLNNAPR